MNLVAAINSAKPYRFSSAVQQVNYPVHNKQPNPAHGKFFIVGSIPMECYDTTRNDGRGGSKFYDTEQAAIDALIAAGAPVARSVETYDDMTHLVAALKEALL